VAFAVARRKAPLDKAEVLPKQIFGSLVQTYRASGVIDDDRGAADLFENGQRGGQAKRGELFRDANDPGEPHPDASEVSPLFGDERTPVAIAVHHETA
jgi:hypothetical protein